MINSLIPIAEKWQAIIFIGIQACGKTTFYHHYYAQSHIHISLDILRTRKREMAKLQECLAENKSFVIDNTNPSKSERKQYIVPAKSAGYEIIGVYFRSVLAEAKIRNAERIGKARIPDKGIGGTAARLELPEFAEGFDKIFYVCIDDGNFKISPWRTE